MYKLARCSLTLAVRPWPGPVVDEARSVSGNRGRWMCVNWASSGEEAKEPIKEEAIPAEGPDSKERNHPGQSETM